MKKNAVTIAIAALLLVIFALLLFTFQVRQSEVVVVATFGKPTDTKNEPGLYFKWPWPVQSLYRFDQRVQTFEDKFSECYLADHSLVLASVYIGWRISDAKAFYPKFQGGSIEAAQRQLEGMLRTAKLQAFGSNSLANLVTTDPAQFRFEQIEQNIQAGVQRQLDEHDYGIKVEFLGFKKIALPEKVTDSVFERMKAERNQYITKAQSDGDRQAAMIKSSAERQAADLLNNAEATAKRIEGEGNAEAAKTLPVFQQNPDLAIFLLQLEAMKSSLNQKATLIFDERTPPFDLFRNLPAANSSPTP